MNVLITGATGFVGSAVLQRLIRDRAGICRGSVRQADAILPAGADKIVVPGLASGTDWRPALQSIHTVVHTAARVHVMHDTTANPLAEFRRVNVEGTLRLARQAAEEGARRFVFISSIKVNGEGTRPGKPYTSADSPAPVDPYGISKYEAEQALWQLSRETGLEVVVIRPVLVYGPGVRANFFAMMRWLDRGVPLPLGAVRNRRSLVALDNLVDLIITCTHHAAAAGQTFLVSDDDDLSTPDLLRRMGAALQKPARLIPVPPVLLQIALRLVGKEGVARRLFGSLQVDIAPTRARLGWSPIVSVDDALQQTAQFFPRSNV